MNILLILAFTFYNFYLSEAQRDPYFNCLPYWTHWGPRGQYYWCCLVSRWCCEGQQSPININTRQVKWNNASCLNMDLLHCSPTKMAIYNNGHTLELQLEFPPGRAPRIGRYVLDRILFRFGNDSSRGSEHTIDRHRMAMEMQLILRHDSYPNIQEAKKHAYGIEVISVLYHAVPDYYDYYLGYYFFQHIPRVWWKGQKVCIFPFPLSILFPPRLDHFYQYEGSLTEPPCTYPIRWNVFHNVKYIGERQLNWFRGLQKDTLYNCPHGRCFMANNYRNLQCLLSNRTVHWNKACPTKYYPSF